MKTYVVTIGEHDSYQPVGVLNGPDDADIYALLAVFKQEMGIEHPSMSFDKRKELSDKFGLTKVATDYKTGEPYHICGYQHEIIEQWLIRNHGFSKVEYELVDFDVI